MASVQLTAREEELLRAVLSRSEISVSDWGAVAKAADFKTAKYARDTWAKIKNKFAAVVATTSTATGDDDDEDEDGAGAAATAAVTKGKGKAAGKSGAAKKGGKKASNITSDNEDSPTPSSPVPAPTPAKKSKAKKPATKKTKRSAFDSDSEDENNIRPLGKKIKKEDGEEEEELGGDTDPEA